MFDSFSLLRGLGAGILLGISIAAPPGPVSALMALRISLKRSWTTGFVVGLGATTADGIFLFITFLGWTKLISQNTSIIGWVYLLGGSVLLVYASMMIIQKLRKKKESDGINQRLHEQLASKNESGFSYFIGLSTGLSSPFQIAWWLTVGLASLSFFGVVVIIGFFVGIIIWLLIFTAGIYLGAAKIANFEKYVLYASSLILYGFAAWFLYSAILAV